MYVRAAVALSLGAAIQHLAYAQTPAAPASPAMVQPASPSVQPAPPSAPKGCTGAEYRQFDFWIGDWDVFTPDGKQAGTNRIEPVMAGCVLHEHWVGKGNFGGQSFNAWDAARKRWHQTWMDGGGTVLLLDGSAGEGSMTLSDADVPGKPDRNVVNEIRWTINADGSVRQHWRTSRDGGKNWSTAFDGRYVRAARPQPVR